VSALAAGADSGVEQWSGKDRADENFPVGSALIRRSLRRHVHAYYAFARNADDIADAPSLAPEDKIARLDVMQAVLLGERDGGAPSASRLRASLAQTGVTPRHATDLLIAFRQDATKQRYASWEELLDYCRTSAMPVGRYLLDLHGESEATHPGSDALCASLQVLNHLQDCAGDLAEMDRCYLPQDLLAQQGAILADLRAGAATPALRRVLDALLDRCDALNATAASLAPACQARGMRLESAVIVGLARRLAARLRQQDPLASRVKLGRGDIAGALLGALRHW
jgi:squalene synthase HpnC